MLAVRHPGQARRWEAILGSYCTLLLDEHEVFSAKSAVPDHFVALFEERDRKLGPPDPEEPDALAPVTYTASRATILKRLDLLGFTEGFAADSFEAWLSENRADWDRHAEDGWGQETAAALKELTYATWRERVPKAIAELYDIEAREAATSEIDRQMREDTDEGWLFFGGYGSLTTLRALLDACPYIGSVTLEITDLIAGGYIDPAEPVCDGRRQLDLAEPRVLAPVMILAEGSSDIRILRRSLDVLYPEVRDYFSFFDHLELSVDGGAPYLVKFLKAFAAARAPLRIVAIFDNDTAGRQAYRAASDLRLGDNITVLHLPDIDIAKDYPTVGPQGHHRLDVNGLACSIEMYLGAAALQGAGGELRPVRWSGYNDRAKAYQGEVEAKGEVEAAFLRSLDPQVDPETARAAFPELAGVWEMIFEVVRASSLAGLQRSYRSEAVHGD